MPNSSAVTRGRRVVHASPRLPRAPKNLEERGGDLRPFQALRQRSSPSVPTRPPGHNPESVAGDNPPPRAPLLPSGPLQASHRDLAKALTVKEAAFRLRVGEDKVRHWFRTGRMHGWQWGGRRCSISICAACIERLLLKTTEMHDDLCAANSRSPADPSD